MLERVWFRYVYGCFNGFGSIQSWFSYIYYELEWRCLFVEKKKFHMRCLGGHHANWTFGRVVDKLA
ncbi:MAG: hypothetical protein Q6364_00480, partial [Candidatus Hermodarchaeota archaeon]|nr:hypothetical protein [Candidatus Hermodarchaeota archaeon]